LFVLVVEASAASPQDFVVRDEKRA